MRVLLISANQLEDPYPVYPLGLDQVAAALPAHHEVEILDLRGRELAQAISEACARTRPELIGVSLRNVDNCDLTHYQNFVPDYAALVAALRKYSAAPVVLGGSAFSIFPAQLLATTGADFGILGQGEQLDLLIDALEGRRALGAVPSLVLAGQPLPLPVRTAQDTPRAGPRTAALRASYLAAGGMLNLQTKRGCPYRCVYCTYPRIEGSIMRPGDPLTVARDARALEDAGARFLFFTDSAFNADEEHNLLLARALADVELSIPWGGFFAPTRPRPGYYETLAAAGLTHVEFGTESLADPVLRAYRKPFNAEDAVAAHESAVGAGLHVAHFLLLGGPGETLETVDETIRVANSLPHTVFFFYCGVRIYPHTPLHQIALEEGVVTADQNLLSPAFYKSAALAGVDVEQHVRQAARRRMNWVVGAMEQKLVTLLSKMHQQGKTGPLWEILAR